MPRLMYDSTDPADIPRGVGMVAYYVDGIYAASRDYVKSLHPGATLVSISAIGNRTAQVGDVEAGCIWPVANAVPWVVRARADGFDPTIYCNELNDWPAVRAAFKAAGVPEPHYWVARYNGVREVPAGSVGRQFAHPYDANDPVANNPWETGGHYDLSIIDDYWPGVDAAPVPLTEEEADMPKLLRGDQKGDINLVFAYETGDLRRLWISDPNAAAVYEAACGPVKTVEQWKVDYIPVGTLEQAHPVDVQALIDALIPPLVAAVKEADTGGLNEAETIEAVKKAFRQGSGPA